MRRAGQGQFHARALPALDEDDDGGTPRMWNSWNRASGTSPAMPATSSTWPRGPAQVRRHPVRGRHLPCLAVPGRVRRRRILGGTVPGIPGGLRTAPGGGPAAGNGGGARHGEPRVRVAGPFGLCPGGRLTRSPVPFPGSIVAGRVRFPRVATGRAVPRHGAGATALPVGDRPGPGRPPGSPYPGAAGRCSGGRAGGAGCPGGTSGHPPVRPGPGAVPRPGGGPGSPP